MAKQENESYNEEVYKYFVRHVSFEQLEAIRIAINKGYIRAQEILDFSMLNPSLEPQTKGHNRCAAISDELYKINSPESGLKVELEQNERGSYTYAKVTINETVLLTVKLNDDPLSLPETSDSRERHARNNPESQPPLLKILDGDKKPSQIINVIITHNSSTDSGSSPAWMSLIFPCHHYKRVLFPKDYYECLEELSEIDSSSDSKQVINDEPKVFPKLKKNAKSKRQLLPKTHRLTNSDEADEIKSKLESKKYKNIKTDEVNESEN